VKKVHWKHWGKQKATARGKGWYVPPGAANSQGHGAKARVVAFHLGTCGGKSAYTAVEWYFPQYGDSFDPDNYQAICP
jgi:hypothetical protein